MTDKTHDRPLILGTAGHIDHGKTSLIRALTGIDADRLPEEQARGMTIDLGFAFTELSGRRVGVVDVPGHEKFIRNMVAGATGIDLVLLVVAADDAVMPQTREHLEIIDLLGVRGGVIALNKIDLVDEDRLELAKKEILNLCEDTCLHGAPIVPVSAQSGAGVEALRDTLGEKIREVTWKPWPSLFRMPIDRRFSLKGHGTVVTGSLMGGDIRAGDEVELWPRGKKVRARSVQSHGTEHQGVGSGRRVAINLPNVKVGEIERGFELAATGYLRPGRRMAVKVRNLNSSPLLLEAGISFRLHLGTTSTNATFALLAKDDLEPGEAAYAIMQTSEPIMAAHDQRFILRSSAHGITIGGGRILMTQPPRVTLKGDIPPWLSALDDGSADERILALLDLEPALGGSIPALCRETGLEPVEAERHLRELAQSGTIRKSPGTRNPGYWTEAFITKTSEELLARIREGLEAARPRLALDAGTLSRKTSDLGSPEFIQWLLDDLHRSGRVMLDRQKVRLPDYGLELTTEEEADLAKLLAIYRGQGLQVEPHPTVDAQSGLSPSQSEALRGLAVDRGDLVELNAERAVHRDTHERLLSQLRDLLAGDNGLTVSALKEELGITRKYAIPLCEHLDRRGFTRREGDLRYAGPAL